MSKVLLVFISGLLMLLLAAVACNTLRILVRSLTSVWRGGEVMPSAIRKAHRLWTGTAVSAWITAFLVSFAETILVMGPTQFPFILLYLTGLLLLVTTLAAGVTAVVLSLSRVEGGHLCGNILKEVVLRNSIIAIFVWISAWAVS